MGGRREPRKRDGDPETECEEELSAERELPSTRTSEVSRPPEHPDPRFDPSPGEFSSKAPVEEEDEVEILGEATRGISGSEEFAERPA